MNAAERWIPLRWPASWRDPSYLALLEGSPINCLLVSGSGAGFEALGEAAGRRGIACLTARGAEAPAAAAGELRIVPRSALDWGARDPVLAVSECVWPSVAETGGGAEAGPTGMPWVDSNGWFVQLARVRAPGRAVWLVFEPPENRVLRPEAYALAAADAEAYGARWLITLATTTAADRAQAAAALGAVGRVLRFFEAHRNWRAFGPRAVLGVLSDFSGAHREAAEEILNLLARRALPFRILEKAAVGARSLEGLKAVIDPDASPASGPLRERLLSFVRAGGLLVTGPQWGAEEGVPAPGDVHGRYRVFQVGRGRLAIAKEEFGDPYLAALDVHLLLGRRHDVIRLWNAGSLNAYYTVAPPGRPALVQLLNYSLRGAAHSVTVGLSERYRAARFWELGAKAPRRLEIRPAAQGIELPLPGFSVYAAIELEG